MQKKLDETDTDFQQRKLAKQVEAAEASKKVTEDEQAARIGAEQSILAACSSSDPFDPQRNFVLTVIS